MREIELITAIDYLLTPFIVAVIFAIANRFRNKHYPKGHPYRNFFLPGIGLKMIGAFAITLLYVYYYKFGDTINYFYHAQIINSSLSESPIKWLNLLLGIADRFDPQYYEYIKQMRWYGASSSYSVPQLTAILGLFTFNSFIPTALIFATISFTGVWALFITFSRLYPKLIKPIAICTLFIPSVVLWGSGVFKDTLCIFGIGWLCYSSFQFFVNENRSIKNLLVLGGSFSLIAYVKIYILACFIPALIGWILFSKTQKLKNRFYAVIINFLSIVAVALAIAVILSINENILGEYSLEKLETTSKITRDYISYVSNLEEGSGYDLGEFEPTVFGMISKFPQAVNVTFFRPYIWEAKKIIVFLNAIESLIIIVLTIKVLFTIGIRRIIKSITSDYTIQFAFTYSIIFAFFVGISSYNFGTLSRYRIPCIPFYVLTLVLIYYQHSKPGSRLSRFFAL